MSKKNKYTELCEQLKSKVQAAGGSRYSDTDRVMIMETLINTPEHESEVFVKDSEEPVVMTPSRDYRESLKPVLEQFGVDKAELDKIQEVEFPKKHAKAVIGLADAAMKDYLDVGRKMILPTTTRDETQMEFSRVWKEEKQEDTRKPVETSPGHYESVPTGERRITAPHYEIKASNKTPDHLVRKEKIDN